MGRTRDAVAPDGKSGRAIVGRGSYAGGYRPSSELKHMLTEVPACARALMGFRSVLCLGQIETAV